MNNIPEELFKFLDDTGKHLSADAILQYIKINSELKEKESDFIEEHLDGCSICSENFRISYDEEMDLDERKKTLEVNVDFASENHLNFIDKEKNIDGIISREGDGFFLIFVKLPPFLEKENVRISFPNSSLIIRIVSIKLNKRYNLNNSESLNLKEISRVYLDYIYKQKINPIKTLRKERSKRNYKYLYFSALAALIILALYFILRPSNQISKIQENKPKVTSNVVPDSLPAKKEIMKPDTTAAVKSETTGIKDLALKENKIESKKPAVKIKVPPEFRDNYVLDGLVNKSKSSNIIISPAIGDTLKKQITFKWAPIQSEEFFIVLVDNKNKEIWSKDISDTRVTLLQKLDPGLYYWKVNSDIKLIAVGKFYVK
jgi:hypothetical protein